MKTHIKYGLISALATIAGCLCGYLLKDVDILLFFGSVGGFITALIFMAGDIASTIPERKYPPSVTRRVFIDKRVQLINKQHPAYPFEAYVRDVWIFDNGAMLYLEDEEGFKCTCTPKDVEILSAI